MKNITSDYWEGLPKGLEPHRTRYIKFINERLQRELSEDVVQERHHIIPTALGGLSKGTIQLTVREHLIAHLILSKCYGGSMSLALYMMSHERGTLISLTSRQYEQVKKNVNEHLRIVHTGVFQTEETKVKRRLSLKGHFWITNGIEDVLLSPNSVVPKDWYRGKTNNAKIHEWHSQLTKEERREQSLRARQLLQEKMDADPKYKAEVLAKREETRKANQTIRGTKYRSKLTKEEKSAIARANGAKRRRKRESGLGATN